MRAAQIIKHTTVSARRSLSSRLYQSYNQRGPVLGRGRPKTIHLSRSISNYHLTGGGCTVWRVGRWDSARGPQSRKYTADAVSGPSDLEPIKDTTNNPLKWEPTPPPRPNINPKTLYEWEEIKPPASGPSGSFWPKINRTLILEIEKRLQLATREAITLPEEKHLFHYRNAYEELVKVPEYDAPLTNPPSETIGVVAVDELWNDECRECPCFCNENIPYILIHGSTENGGKGVTFKMLLKEVGDWLYGAKAEEVLENERGKVGLTILTYLVPGGENEDGGIMDMKLYWYLRKAEGGIEIG